MNKKITKKEKSKDQEKKILHQYYKQLKVGMIQWDDVPYEYRGLLRKYYGVLGNGEATIGHYSGESSEEDYVFEEEEYDFGYSG